MESLLLGFKESHEDDVVEDKSHSFKLVPWISWDEWNFVKGSLFSSSPDSMNSALQRISTWRSRGCIPVVIEVTASIIEIQQKDPFFRDDLSEDALQSQEMLSMLYCMAIMRLVNGVVEKTRKKTEVSIGEAANAIGIPRMLIDIRHEGSHRELPSLQLVRLASMKALDWLKSYYWEPQEKAIPINETADLRKEIKCRLRELALCLKAKQTSRSSSLQVKGKRVRHMEHLHGHNKFLFLMAGKTSHCKSTGSKKQVTKSLKNILRLYTSFSSEVVYILLELLLKALDSSDFTEHVVESQIGHEKKQTECDDWKCVVLKLSNKEPELLLTLLYAVLEKIETQEEIMRCEIGEHHNLESFANSRQIELLSYLFEWLVENLKTLYPVSHKEPTERKDSLTEPILPKETLLGLLRKCLLLSCPGNKKLMDSALVLAQMTGDNSLLYKLKKFASIWVSNSYIREEISVDSHTKILLSEQEDSIRRAEEKFKVIRHRQMKGTNVKPTDSNVGVNSRWVVAKSWNPCPIGMLPHNLGFSGHLPVLVCNDESREARKVSDSEEHWELNLSGKREADCPIEELDSTFVKKMKENEADCESYDKDDTACEGVMGRLMVDGVWKKVAKEELLTIASAVRLLV
ncbi:las1-like family protein [Forsythia ovata]|uniref:Las1-like family protein n=1 Tax=Forsythia ovata TaxID=205694 RepID=A0ABD1W463_9LAMI